MELGVEAVHALRQLRDGGGELALDAVLDGRDSFGFELRGVEEEPVLDAHDPVQGLDFRAEAVGQEDVVAVVVELAVCLVERGHRAVDQRQDEDLAEVQPGVDGLGGFYLVLFAVVEEVGVFEVGVCDFSLPQTLVGLLKQEEDSAVVPLDALGPHKSGGHLGAVCSSVEDAVVLVDAEVGRAVRLAAAEERHGFGEEVVLDVGQGRNAVVKAEHDFLELLAVEFLDFDGGLFRCAELREDLELHKLAEGADLVVGEQLVDAEGEAEVAELGLLDQEEVLVAVDREADAVLV